MTLTIDKIRGPDSRPSLARSGTADGCNMLAATACGGFLSIGERAGVRGNSAPNYHVGRSLPKVSCKERLVTSAAPIFKYVLRFVFLALTSLLIFTAPKSSSAIPANEFEQANKLYEQGKFKEAIAAY